MKGLFSKWYVWFAIVVVAILIYWHMSGKNTASGTAASTTTAANGTTAS